MRLIWGPAITAPRRLALAAVCGLLLLAPQFPAESAESAAPAVPAASTASTESAAPTAPPAGTPDGRAARPRALSFPVHEPFDSAVGSLGTAVGSATFQSGGWLRLTSAAGNQSGAWEMNDSFSTGLGIVAEFTYATYGGTAFDGKRGDGLAFFLANGASANGTGAPGGSLGYACGGNPCNRAGVPGAFLGIGIDEFGNFSSASVGNGGPGTQANRIVLRGGGNNTTGYRFGTSTPGPTQGSSPCALPATSVETCGRGDYRTVRVTVTPSGGQLLVSLWSDTGPGTAMQQIITDFNVSTIANQPALPPTLKVGFSGGTGGATNIHEIGDLKINVPADLSVTKTANVSTVPAGTGPVTYTVKVSNSNENDVMGAFVRDAVPGLTGVTWTCTATTGSSCGQPSGSGNNLATTVNLLRNGSATYTITGTAPAQPATLTNTVTVTPPADRSDTDPTNNTASVTTTVTARADVAAIKNGVGTGPVTPGQQFDFRVTAVNNGPSNTTNVRLRDTLPAGLTFVSSGSGCTAAGQNVTCPALASLASGATSSWTFRVRLDPAYTGDGSTLVNTATLVHDVPDPNTANNTATAIPPGGVTVPRADLRTVKRTGTTALVSPGESFDFTVTVTNDGPSNARQARITDPLPTAFAFVSSPDGCTASGQTVRCGPVTTLTPGASVSWTFRVRLSPTYEGNGSDLRNTATASSATEDPDETNNSGSAGPPGGRTNPPTADIVLTKRTD
ncbi:hypothetical protein [Streptomyces yaizuensis]|uniref:DUF11 domain-containing protein n=1 Tax=Streptomyces yaizuensis TaxID=2989713 RepID=A0ABQ5P016_9ACTN|nr:hypothetical protein [Streptomyces sp. YSPA8]GLF95943.1 DUF11 domain-containing protein [Streptomyces sp. YSPA8]